LDAFERWKSASTQAANHLQALEMSEPSNKPHHDLRTFVCSGCKTSEIVEVALQVRSFS